MKKTIEDKINLVLVSSMTGAAISKETGIATSIISRLRSGEREVSGLSLETAQNLANLYDRMRKGYMVAPRSYETFGLNLDSDNKSFLTIEDWIDALIGENSIKKMALEIPSSAIETMWYPNLFKIVRAKGFKINPIYQHNGKLTTRNYKGAIAVGYYEDDKELDLDGMNEKFKENNPLELIVNRYKHSR